ncbi:hypothetical protein [Pseudoalteromonas denitrificans]|uniref:P pilus assembly protein, chaperone PapD n=1 Tax=Pseudoalteromonas denitrificans DSM 6059 TaxID=1123010 RepID=A0A1I1HY09_9GAMM|nr:hypothetical protein [Pseudoalteromonas denitrificans]SFC25840.1 hypothetical protein SAMN02745724_01287 [Pseudoalteromonas denitrificans DSM 6059]
MNKIAKSIFLLAPLLASASFSQMALAGAASITFDKYRIVLDKNSQSAELTLRNSEGKNAECLLDLSHYNFSQSNELLEVASVKSTYMPAKKLLRYSPRSVSIPSQSSQRVKISYRRRANLTPGEYISFFRISCSEKNENLVKGKPNIGAKVNYNLPVHVRIGDAAASTAFEVTSITPFAEGYKLALKQTRKGNRSLVGGLKLIDQGSGEVIKHIRNFSLYRPAEVENHVFILDEKPSGNVLVEFSEKSNVFNRVTQKIEIKNALF